MLKTLEGHSDGLVALTHDDHYVYSGSKDRSLHIWSRDTLECVHVISGFPCGCKGVSDGGPLYTITAHGLTNKLFAAWERDSWKQLAEFSLPADSDLQVIVLDPQHAFVSARDGKVFVIDRQTLEVARVLQQSTEGIWDLATDGDHLYTASVDHVIRAWSKETWEVTGTCRGHRANIQSITLDDSHLYSIATDKTIMVWNKQTCELEETLKKVYRKGMLALLCTEEHLAALNTSQGLKVWRKGQWNEVQSEHPSIRSNRGTIDAGRAYFGLSDGSVAVFSREELGV